ncbi:MAG: hypothetical protein ACO307_14285 [Ilumatobacteraceae bacterium]
MDELEPVGRRDRPDRTITFADRDVVVRRGGDGLGGRESSFIPFTARARAN